VKPVAAIKVGGKSHYVHQTKCSGEVEQMTQKQRNHVSNIADFPEKLDNLPKAQKIFQIPKSSLFCSKKFGFVKY
jgi:hypothetical protein